MNYLENRNQNLNLNKTEQQEYDSIPINLKNELLDLNLNRQLHDKKYLSFKKTLILPNGDSFIVNDITEIMCSLNQFFNETPIYKFINYFINVEINLENNRINIEILPIIESA